MATPAPSANPTQVKVEKGDSLSQIALNYLGSASKYKQLAAINNISNPNFIYVGQIIKLKADSSGSSSSSSSSTTTDSNKAIVKHFGLQSNADNTLFATWTWSKKNTESYKVAWDYATGDGVWFVGSHTSITVDSDNPSASRQSTYGIPSNATKVRFKVKPISKKYTKNKKETSYWTAKWSDVKTFNVSETPPETPPVPTVEIEKYKLTATLDNLDVNATGIQFQIVRDNAAKSYKSGKVTITSAHAAYSCTVAAGSEYKVRCRSYKGSQYSDWSDYSSNYATIPAAPKTIKTLKAKSKTSVYLEWDAIKTATSYDIEYATKKEYFDGSDKTTVKTGVESTHYEITGLQNDDGGTGGEYFFRIRAVNDKGSSGWSVIKSVVIGEKPAAPTTWSSVTKAVTGEEVILYWVHNSKDGSSQVYAILETTINGATTTRQITNTTDEEEKDKTSSYVIDTSSYAEGTTIDWRVCTAGVTNEVGEYSIMRTIEVNAPASLSLNVTDKAGDELDTVESFPFYIAADASPATQTPIGYHLTIRSNDIYTTVDATGNDKIVSEGEAVYSKYFDVSIPLRVEFSAFNVDLESNMSYTVECVVTMDTGLTATAYAEFDVEWSDIEYQPNAEVSVDPDTLTAEIRPYVEKYALRKYRVQKSGSKYIQTSIEVTEQVYGELVKNAETDTGEQVYSGVAVNGDESKSIYFCEVEEKTIYKNVLLSVYRREFDGSFVEIATDLDGEKALTVTDPHPALDYARYRIVAVAKDTGAISYYDPPGYPIGGTAVIIQWEEDWSAFDTTEEAALEQPPWTGSMLKLPYNIDVSDNHRSDVALVEYMGRSHPVSYYGTQLGHSSTWNMSVPKEDKDALYALRRLARWMGDVYVREPSGSGYWANITVSFSQKHCEVTIPVTLDVTRVEGGM